MKNIKLEKLFLHNFKGARSAVEIDFKGQNVKLVGKNGTGKTTIFDAFTFALFGKDSLGRDVSNKSFEIKPKDKATGESIPNLESTVEITLSVNGEPVKLKRVYREVYKSKRGSSEKVFDGNTTDYYINGVLKKKYEYDNYIKDYVLDENLFKLLTDVLHFSKLNDDTKREILEQLITVTDEEIIAANEDLHLLEEHLILGNTVEDVIKIQQQEQKAINKQLKTDIPASLKALHELEYSNLDERYNDEVVSKKIEQSYERLSDIESKLASGTNQSDIQELTEAKFVINKQINTLEREIEDILFKDKQEQQSKIQEEKNKLADLENEIKSVNNDLQTLTERIKNGSSTIKDLEAEREELYVEYDKLDEMTFTEDVCSHCGQALPKDKLEEAQEHFNLHKAEELEKITKKGKNIASDIEKYTKAVDKFREDLKVVSSELEVKTTELAKQKEVIQELENMTINKPVEVSEKETKIETLQTRIKSLDNQIAKAKKSGSNDVLEQARKEIKNEIDYLTTQKAEHALKMQNDKKIKKLEEQLRDLNVKFEEAQKIINLGEKFRVIKAKALEENINDNFELIKFKLFHKHQNGAIKNVCDALFVPEGVKYDSASNGQKINIGVDIIKGLQKIYRVSAPIFIDNAEGVSDWLIDTSDQQLIKMYVDPEVNILEIHRENEEEK